MTEKTEFKEVQPSDGQWVRELLKKSDFYGCEYAFGNTYMWSAVYDIRVARYKDFCLMRNKYGYLFPKGCGDIKEVIAVLREECKRECKSLCFTNVDKKSLDFLCKEYPCEIEVSTNRDLYDYVYRSDSLSGLRGKKLHAKRNHLNRFYENDWTFESITEDNIEEVTAMHNRWCDEKNIYCDSEKLKESGAVIRGLDKFFELGLVGGIIRVKNPCGEYEIEAYTFGESAGNRNDDLFVVHVEKAFTNFQGAYTAINREFVSRFCQDYEFVNREEDLGEPNLRKAKMSYCPEFMVEKYRVKFK